ncbi:aminotransferase class IV [Rhizosphaericola mali]|nr:aminotransferase class IV [Rhizosphaericola mali]
MFQFIETIHYRNGKMPLINWHNQRFLSTQKENWNAIIYPNILDILQKKFENYRFENDLSYKIRLVYGQDYLQVEAEKYTQKSISELYLIHADEVNYSYKFFDRSKLNQLKSKISTEAEIIAVKQNHLTDTSFTNIALYDGDKWYTPLDPLLKGVQRQYLIEKNILHPKEILVQDISNYSQIALFNAMVDWEKAWKFPINQINPALLNL